MKIRFLVIVSALLVCVSLWHFQFRYALNPVVETDRFFGEYYAQIIKRLGQPKSETEAHPYGYEIEPPSEFNRVLVYEPLWGNLLLYFNDNECVGSVFRTRAVQF